MEALTLSLRLVFIGAVAYLIGSFPTGVLLTRTWVGVDPRLLGSTHTGGLNVWRVTGRLWLAVLTALVDGAKGIIAVQVAGELAPTLFAEHPVPQQADDPVVWISLRPSANTDLDRFFNALSGALDEFGDAKLHAFLSSGAQAPAPLAN